MELTKYSKKSITSTRSFKYALTKRIKTPKYYNAGTRKTSIQHARLRMKCSNLNEHLYRRHLTDDKSCQCGAPTENNEHYLLFCPLYTDIRNQFINQEVGVNTLLYGDSNLGNESNQEIFAMVHNFIEYSKRFN